MKLDILSVLDGRLKQKSEPVTVFDKDLKRLVKDMFETMYAAPGVGLAAPQVGIFKRLLVFTTPCAGGGSKEYVFVNPEIVGASEAVNTSEEGCLSVPDIFTDITRPAEVTVKFLDADGKEHVETFTELGATAAQHEMDHLDGVVITDYMTPLKRDMVMRKLKKRERNDG